MNFIRLLFWNLIFFFVSFGCVNAYVFINEVELNPTGTDTTNNEWHELYNDRTDPNDLSGWKLLDTSSPIATLAGSIPAGSYFYVNITWSELVNDGDMLRLEDYASFDVDTTPYLYDNETSSGNSMTWQRIPDCKNSWQFREGTPGATNGGGTGGAIPEFPSFIVPVLIVFLSMPLAARFAGI